MGTDEASHRAHTVAVWTIAVGISSICKRVGGLASAVYFADFDPSSREVMGFVAMSGIQTLGGLVLSPVLIWAAGDALMLRPRGRRLLLAYGWLASGIGVVLAIATLVFGDRFYGHPPRIPGQPPLAVATTIDIVTQWLPLPIFLVVVLRRRRVRASFEV